MILKDEIGLDMISTDGRRKKAKVEDMVVISFISSDKTHLDWVPTLFQDRVERRVKNTSTKKQRYPCVLNFSTVRLFDVLCFGQPVFF